MARKYKTYDEEFKKNIVKLMENGKYIADISREYGLTRSILYEQKKKYGTITTNEGAVTNNAEIEKIIKENKILKKAMAIFTRKQKTKYNLLMIIKKNIILDCYVSV